MVAADEIIGSHENPDAGLEAFLRAVDPGIPRPKVSSAPAKVDLGAVAREAALIRTVTLENTTRGYVQAELSTSEPWLEVKPTRAHLWSGIPVDVHVPSTPRGSPFAASSRPRSPCSPRGWTRW